MLIVFSLHLKADNFRIVEEEAPVSDLQVAQVGFDNFLIIHETILTEKTFQNKSDIQSEKLPQCWIVPVSCSCQRFITQYCDEGLHGTIEEWGDRICCEGCGDGCISI